MLYRGRQVREKLRNPRWQEEGVRPWQVACDGKHCSWSCLAEDQCYVLALKCLFAWMLCLCLTNQWDT